MSHSSLRGFLTATRGWIVLFCVVVLALALLTHRQYTTSYREDVHARLHTIAELKASEISGWRRERVSDGQFFTGNQAVIALAQRVLGAGGDADAARLLLHLLSRMQRNHQYQRIALHDVEGREQLSSPSDGVPDDGHMAEMVRVAVADGTPAFLALHANNGELPHMIIVAPLQPGLGAVVIQVNPTVALAELVRRWPVPAQTAETLILRRDGDEVMYLNTILGPSEADAMPRLPVTRTDLADVQAILGGRGTLDTHDRHGVAVVASMLPIEGSSWHLVVSQTQDELYGPLRTRAAVLAVVSVLLVVAGVGVLGFVWSAQNRRLEEAERTHLSALQLMAQVVEASPVVLFRWRVTDGLPIEWVSSNVSRWGYSAERLMSNDPLPITLVHEDDRERVLAELARFLEEGADHLAQEYRLRKPDGSVFWVNDRSTVVRNPQGEPQYLQGILTDITENKQLQAQFVQAQKMETVGRLAGGVAHDFNNLLTVINGYAEFALSDIPPEDPLHEMVQEIYDAGQRASGLTRQLLAFSRRQVVQPVSLDLNVVAEQMHKMLQRLIGEDIRLTFDLDPGLGRVRADAGQFEQVIMNLAVNSRDAMPQGGTLVVMTRNLDEGADQIMLSVSDTGCGMDEATQQRLFEPFFTTKKAGQGTGLGLATVYGIVTQAGGRIEVSSAVGRGSTFRVYLPRLAGDTGGDAATARPAGLVGGTERVLIVEDEESLRRIAQRILTAAGYTTLCAANGDEAITILDGADARVDLLLTDVVMPGMSGHELAARVTVTHPHLKVLFASGYLPEAFPDRGRLGPDVQFLAKPYSPSSLTAKVRDVLDRT